MELRIVFLDIDGVLNSNQFAVKRFESGAAADWPDSDIDPQAIEYINDLAKDCKVVLSSSWRNGTDEPYEVLKRHGFKGEFIGETPSGCGNCCRGNEIKKRWLTDNAELLGCYASDFKSYVIIDDDSDMLLEQAGHFFNVDYFTGITPKTTYKIRRFFGLPTNLTATVDAFAEGPG